MSQRFEGATTTPDDEIPDPSVVQEPERRGGAGAPAADSGVVQEPERPPRPILVELGSAILIVGGITALVGWVGTKIAGTSIAGDAGLPTAVFIGLNVVLIAIGVLIRDGRHWRLCINIVAVAIFLYLTAFPNPIAVFFGVLDTIVFFGLIRHRAWFEWKPAEATPVSGAP